MKRTSFLILLTGLLLAGCATKPDIVLPGNPGYTDTTLPTAQRVELILAGMSLEQKVLQMVQIERMPASMNINEIVGIGSVLSGGGSVPLNNSPQGWKRWIKKVQDGVRGRDYQIPALYGIDAVHGHASLVNATVFPHNIGLGAADNPELLEQMGRIVAGEMLQTRVPWNFGPCITLAEDPRWGRTYESYSSDPHITAALGAAYVRGFQNAGGIATAKHFLGDGQTTWGTGLDGGIDRGDTRMTMDEIRRSALMPYRELVDSGVKVVMVSFSSINGLKMHENRELITGVLKEELGFDGFVITDWEAIHELPYNTYDEQVIAAVNAGCDMLMEPYTGGEAWRAIEAGVENGDIEMSRVDDAVRRILTVKIDSGVFDDPMLKNLASSAPKLRDPDSLAVARQLVEESMVLLKNEGELLPIREGQTILVLGPGADDLNLQCGGWTLTWQGTEQYGRKVEEGTTLLESLNALSAEQGFTIITDPLQASAADLVLLVLAETPYAEWEGDNPSPDLTGLTAHPNNITAIETAASLGIPTATVILAGRHVSIEDYTEQWNALVMAYLPGTEGDGMGRVLTGRTGFSGSLPMPWYKNVEGKTPEEFEILYDTGYGLQY